VRIQAHVCGSPVATAAALQIDACITNFLIHELYPYRVAEHLQIVDFAPETTIEDGHLTIPDRPGIGVELEHERLAPFLWHECTT